MREQIHRDKSGLAMSTTIRRYLERKEETQQKKVATRTQRQAVTLPKLKFMEDK